MPSLVACFLLAFVGGLSGHPQCLDGKPPFESSSRLKFCEEYAEVGCCTNLEDTKIQRRFEHLQSKVSAKCVSYIKELLCQKCSPYSAHLYNFEDTGVATPTPGLCSGYCNELYNICGREALALLSDDADYVEAVEQKQRFCNYSKLEDGDYCYPTLKTNPILTEKFTKQNNDSENCMCLRKIGEGHSLVTFIENNPTDGSLMYIGEQSGKVYVYRRGVKRRRPFIDLSQEVLLSKYAGDERGLLGMAFHPNFARNKRFFLYYVLRTSRGQTVRVSQWIARNNLVARKGSERRLLDIPQPYFNHNGGQLLFGDDGYLYIFTGDGGGAGDPENNSQDLKTLLGKALRINVNHQRRGAYSIPRDNPFIRGANRKEIYAYGLRNAWRCSKDTGDSVTGAGKGRIICGDVGQNKFEEIDIIVKGGNYGWPAREGFECYRKSECGLIGDEVLPIHAYNHSYGKSITGGYVYRGCDYPQFNGNYIYGDFTSGRMFRLEEDGRKWKDKEIKMCSSQTCTGNWVSTYGKGITTFGVNRHGDILMSSTSDVNAFGYNSVVYKLIMQPFRRQDPATCNPEAEVNQVSPAVNRSSSSFPRRFPRPKRPKLVQTTSPSSTIALPSASDDADPLSALSQSLYDPLTGNYIRGQSELADVIARYREMIEATKANIRERERQLEMTSATRPWSWQTPRGTTPTTTNKPTHNWRSMSRVTSIVEKLTVKLSTTTQHIPKSTVSPWRSRTYEWQQLTSASPPRLQTPSVYVRRVKSTERTTGYYWRQTTPRPLPPLTDYPYSFTIQSLPLPGELSYPVYGWQNPHLVYREEPPATPNPISLVTNYQLPDYLRHSNVRPSRWYSSGESYFPSGRYLTYRDGYRSYIHPIQP